MPQTLAEIKALLAAYGLRPKHRYGQNFLHDHNQMKRIMAAADLQPGDRVLEVGAGTGALSECLLEAGARLVTVEIDHALEPILCQRLGDRAVLLTDDVLSGKHEINPRVMAALGDEAFKLIANLPYNVASPLLVNLAVDHPNMTGGVVMVQKEVADRLTAQPGNKDYGPLGILVAAMCRVRRVGVLSPGCFWPQPKVESAIVALQRRDQPLTSQPRLLAEFLHRLFSKRRKQLGAILGRRTPLPPDVDPLSRPEQLSIEQLVRLSQWPH